MIQETLLATNSKPNALLLLGFRVFCINDINRMPNMNRKNVGTGPTVDRYRQAKQRNLLIH
jgi:hypothetical protein